MSLLLFEIFVSIRHGGSSVQDGALAK